MFVLTGELCESRARVPENRFEQAAEKGPEGPAEARAHESQQAIRCLSDIYLLFNRKWLFVIQVQYYLALGVVQKQRLESLSVVFIQFIAGV